MLGWLVAAALPWLINRWSRNRYEQTPWAAIDLLLEALRHESQRLRVQNWLLLAIRTALVAFAALAVAEPLWRTAGAAGGVAGAVHHVVAVDCSLSMAAESDGTTRLQRARAAARELLEASSTGDVFSVIAWGEDAQDVLGRPVQGPAQALAAIAAIEQQDTHNTLPDALAAVESAIARGAELFPHATRVEVAWLTDRCESTWGELVDANDDVESDGVAARWNQLADRATYAFPLADDQQRANFAIVGLQLDPPLPVAGATTAISIVVQQFDGAAPRTATIELRIGGAVQDSQRVDVPEAGVATVRFDRPALAPGNQQWEARLNAAGSGAEDALPRDNERRLAVRAMPRIRAAVVADRPMAGDDVARALNPRGAAASPQAPAVERIAAANLATTLLTDYAVVVLCDVATFTPTEAARLRRYVADGGALWFILGDRFEAPAYRVSLGPLSDGTPALLPLQPTTPTSGGPWRLDPRDYQHRILQPFRGRERAGLLSAAVIRYVPLKPWESSSTSLSKIQIAAALDSGDPVLVLGDYGRGRVAVLATDPTLSRESDDAPWTNLAISPSFVPLAQRTVESLAMQSRVDAQNLLAGAPLPTDPPSAAGRVTWTSPYGETAAAPETNLAGFYRRVPADGISAADSAETVFAVNADPRESDLTTLDSRLLRDAGAAADPSAAALTATARRSLSWPLLAAALGLLLIERIAVHRLAGSAA